MNLGDNVEWGIGPFKACGEEAPVAFDPPVARKYSHSIRVRFCLLPLPDSPVHLKGHTTPYYTQRFELFGQTDDKAQEEFHYILTELKSCAAIFVRDMGLYRSAGDEVERYQPAMPVTGEYEG